MKCICGSGAKEEIEDLKSKFILLLEGRNWRDRALKRYKEEIKGLQNYYQKVGDSNVRLKVDRQTLQEKVTALQKLWGASIKNNGGLRDENKKLKEEVVAQEKDLVSLSACVDWVNSSSRPWQGAKSRRGPE